MIVSRLAGPAGEFNHRHDVLYVMNRLVSFRRFPSLHAIPQLPKMSAIMIRISEPEELDLSEVKA